MTKLTAILLSLFLLILAVHAYSQDMNPEAGKLYNKGNSLLKAGNYKGAIENYDKALAIEKDYRTYYQKGIAQKKTRDLEKAKSSFEECIKLKNDFSGSYNALGGVYFQMGNYLEAIKNFEKVLTLTNKASIQKKVKKNLSLALSKLGNQELTNGNAKNGVDYLTKAVEFSNYDAAYLSLAKIYSELGEWDQSIAASEDALKYRSKISKGGPYYYMGISYKGKGDNDKAKNMFKKAKGDVTYRKTAEYELSLLN
ncbi:MAG: tetratricopeptide repeat protein [Bacteroidetes bacterium]|nr:tetratricopeptide repeat protein [Bacteroidota bacterium]